MNIRELQHPEKGEAMSCLQHLKRVPDPHYTRSDRLVNIIFLQHNSPPKLMRKMHNMCKTVSNRRMRSTSQAAAQHIRAAQLWGKQWPG